MTCFLAFHSWKTVSGNYHEKLTNLNDELDKLNSEQKIIKREGGNTITEKQNRYNKLSENKAKIWSVEYTISNLKTGETNPNGTYLCTRCGIMGRDTVFTHIGDFGERSSRVRILADGDNMSPFYKHVLFFTCMGVSIIAILSAVGAGLFK